MTIVRPVDLRGSIYETYGSQHAGGARGKTNALVYRRDIRPLLPSAAEHVIDLVAGGQLVRLLQAEGFDPESIDVRPEQATFPRAAGVTRVRQGDFRVNPAAYPAHCAAFTATDLPEHLTKPEVLQIFNDVTTALMPGGVFVGRVPNAASPLGGHIPTETSHQTSFIARSIRELAAAGRLRLGLRAFFTAGRTAWPAPGA